MFIPPKSIIGDQPSVPPGAAQVKLSPAGVVDDTIDAALRQNVDGFVLTNTSALCIRSTIRS